VEKIDSSIKVNGIGVINVLSEDKGLIQGKLVVKVKKLIRKMLKRVDNILVVFSKYVYCDNRRSNGSTDVL